MVWVWGLINLYGFPLTYHSWIEREWQREFWWREIRERKRLDEREREYVRQREVADVRKWKRAGACKNWRQKYRRGKNLANPFPLAFSISLAQSLKYSHVLTICLSPPLPSLSLSLSFSLPFSLSQSLCLLRIQEIRDFKWLRVGFMLKVENTTP